MDRTPSPTAAALDAALRRIAPLWPLDRFVAVNPFLGLADHDVAEAAERMARVAGAEMTLPRAFYREAVEDHRITDAHLADALEAARSRTADAPRRRAQLPADVAELKREILRNHPHRASELLLPTVATTAAEVTGQAWDRVVRDRVSAWAAGYFDRGQAAWGSPWSSLSPWAAWRAEAVLDRTPEVLGVPGFRAFVGTLPEDAREMIETGLEALGIPDTAAEEYLHRLLMQLPGWSGWLRYQLWEAELREGSHTGLEEFCAILVAWELGLREAFASKGVPDRWAELRTALDAPAPETPAADLALDLVLHDAWERAWHDRFLGWFPGTETAGEAAGTEAGAAGDERPSAQAAFCIDVRSEVFRRALEAQDPSIQTLGFAGFFGFSLEYRGVGEYEGGARCPVLLTPSTIIPESVRGDEAATREAGRLRSLRRSATQAWKAFKMGAVSCFGFVGPVGLAYAGKLIGDGFGWSRPVPHPDVEALSSGERAGRTPDLTPRKEGGITFGMDAKTRMDTAEGVLRAMSLTDGFARVVLLAGHGSTTTNNPHATGLDCGACGGHTGEANARVAAAVLNDPQVRSRLVKRGIEIPGDTVFVAGLHDTTTDEVRIFAEGVPESHRADLAELRRHLAEAGRAARAERSGRLSDPLGNGAGARPEDRSKDWSQVRPEWGLAGCAAFVAAPRSRTRDVNLGGRAFLHDYAWEEDSDFSVLELIMTAPMVVASWISLQYFGSSVDNRVYGSGNKVLHNVVSGVGVLEGNGGDLRTGLPWQSVHDGEAFAHEPIRLNVVIEAPREAMLKVLSDHPQVRELLDNGWLNLWAMDEGGIITHRYAGGLSWDAVQYPAAAGGRRREQAA